MQNKLLTLAAHSVTRLTVLLVATVLMMACSVSDKRTSEADSSSPPGAQNTEQNSAAETQLQESVTESEQAGLTDNQQGMSESTPAETNTHSSTQNLPDDVGQSSADSLMSSQSFTSTQIGSITDAALEEISGLAVSRVQNGLLWAINDSGNPSKLFAVDTSGQLIASLNLGISNRDWEDMAAVTLRGQPYLVIADIGDNLGIQDSYSLHFFAEPQLDNALLPDPLLPVASISLSYEDGSHNSEAMAIADNTNIIYLVSKSDEAKIYALEIDLDTLLGSTTDQTVQSTAMQIATLPQINQSMQDSLLGSLAGVNLANITAMDMASDGRSAWFMTYRGIYRATREQDQSWSDAFTAELQKIHAHSLNQGEAMAVSSAENTVYFTSEKLPAPLWKLSPE